MKGIFRSPRLLETVSLAAVLALVAAFVGAGANLHPRAADGHHHALEAEHAHLGEHVHAGETHPGQPLHVEANAPHTRSPCQLCWAQTQARGLLLAHGFSVALLPPAGELGTPRRESRARRPRAHRPSRAPPSA